VFIARTGQNRLPISPEMRAVGRAAASASGARVKARGPDLKDRAAATGHMSNTRVCGKWTRGVTTHNLARAGLRRLGREDRATGRSSSRNGWHARNLAQGAIGSEIAIDDAAARAALKTRSITDTQLANCDWCLTRRDGLPVRADGSCRTPIAGLDDLRRRPSLRGESAGGSGWTARCGGRVLKIGLSG